MKVNRTLSAILNGIWAIEPKSAQGYLPMVAQIIKGDFRQPEPQAYWDEHDHREDARREATATVNGVSIFTKVSRYADFRDAPKGSIAVIPISGPIIKVGECGEPGSRAWSGWITEANQSENISGIILKIDSPGGQVSGTSTLADAIKMASKPITAFVDDGMAASAAYWIASAADEIVLSHETSEVGSIGVFMTLADWYGYFKEQGLNVVDVYATQSTEKNRVFYQALEGDHEPLKKEMLDPIADQFINTVKVNRAGKINLSAGNPFKGKMYMASDAIAIGLADRVSSFEQLVADMASKIKMDDSQNSNSAEMSNKKWGAVAGTIGVESLEQSEEGVYLSADQMDSLEAQLSLEVVEQSVHQETSDALESLQAENETNLELVNSSLEALGEDPAESVSAGVTRLTTLAEEYGRASGAAPTRVKSDKSGEEITVSEADKINEAIAAKAGVDINNIY